MGLRKDFLIHKRKTVESFRLVRADISSININIEHIRNMLSSMESRVSTLGNEVSSMHKALDKCSADINMQQNNNLNIQSRIEDINKSISSAVAKVSSFKDNINNIIFKNQKISKRVTANNNLAKKLLSKSKTQSLKNIQLNSAIRNSQEEIKKIKNFLNRKLRTVKKRDLELEARIKKQRRNILALSKKIKSVS